MATATTTRPNFTAGGSFRDVDWATYCRLRDDPAFEHRRMTYLDGELMTVSPQLVHDFDSRRILFIVVAVARASRIRCMALGSTTLKKEGRGPILGAGKEPDEGFYLGADVARMRGKTELDLTVDPPPNLAIEVDNTANSESALVTYARIGVPEVWRFDVNNPLLWFGILEGEHYRDSNRSLGLPRLAPGLVIEAIRAYSRHEDDTDWLDAWARKLPEPDLEVA